MWWSVDLDSDIAGSAFNCAFGTGSVNECRTETRILEGLLLIVKMKAQTWKSSLDLLEFGFSCVPGSGSTFDHFRGSGFESTINY